MQLVIFSSFLPAVLKKLNMAKEHFRVKVEKLNNFSDYVKINEVMQAISVRYCNCAGFEVVLNDESLNYLLFNNNITDLYLN